MADEKDASALLAHQLGTYLSLRLVLAAIGFALPVVVAGAGWWQCAVPGHPIGGSLSAYYHHVAQFEFLTARDLLVGGLFAAATCLYAYKGYSTRENVALNLAAAFALGVALLPTGHGPLATDPQKAADVCITFMGSGYEDGTIRPRLHTASAVLFFLCLAYVSIRRGRDTLRLLLDLPNGEAKAAWYNRGYVLTGTLMILSPAIAMVLSSLDREGRIAIFCVEAAGVWAFCAYWTLKTLEMRETKLDVRLAHGAVRRERVHARLPKGKLDRALRKLQAPSDGMVERVVPVTRLTTQSEGSNSH